MMAYGYMRRILGAPFQYLYGYVTHCSRVLKSFPSVYGLTLAYLLVLLALHNPESI